MAKMRQRWRAITYKPKAEAVRDGLCRQTIRKGEFAVGDIQPFHGWEGLPYRSPWSWRREFVLIEVVPILAAPTYFAIGGAPRRYDWRGSYADELARLDYIDPPTGAALRDVLMGFHGRGKHELSILRW